MSLILNNKLLYLEGCVGFALRCQKKKKKKRVRKKEEKRGGRRNHRRNKNILYYTEGIMQPIF